MNEEFKESEIQSKKSITSPAKDDDEEIDSASCVYSKEFEVSLRKLEGINQNEIFLDLV